MMKKIKITVLKKVFHEELANLYERSSSNMCNMQEDMTFIVVDLNQPKGMCAGAWHSLYPYVFALANGTNKFFDGWLKEDNKAIVSCDDGIRPVSFLVEVLDEN